MSVFIWKDYSNEWMVKLCVVDNMMNKNISFTNIINSISLLYVEKYTLAIALWKNGSM